MFNSGLIDSLKLRVPMERVQILDKRIITDFIRYYPTLDQLDSNNDCVDEELQRAPPFVRLINGITYRFYPKAFINAKKTAEEYMVFQISAKMCKTNYFDGITAKNVIDIIKDINSLGVLSVTEGDFLHGIVSDIDICINQLIDEKSLKAAFSLIQQFPQPSKKPLIHFINQTNQKGQRNLGIDFNKREKATNSVPYCKIYHKGYELLSKSVDFYRAFLEPMRASVIDNLVRYEFTIKAHKHKEYLIEKGFNADFKTLKDLLAISPSDLSAIAKSGLPHYIEHQKRTHTDSEQSPTDIAMSYWIESLINYGFDTEKLLGFTYHIEDPSSRSRMKTKAKKIIEKLTVNNSLNLKIQQNERSNKFLRNFGFPF